MGAMLLRQACGPANPTAFTATVQAPHPGRALDTLSTLHSSHGDHTAPVIQSEATSPSRTPTIEESILEALQAATAPYRFNEPQADSGLQLDLDTIMANASLTNRLYDHTPAAMPPYDNLAYDVTLPQLPPSMYGVELLPEVPITDEGDGTPIVLLLKSAGTLILRRGLPSVRYSYGNTMQPQ